jgi:hypothetical protein
LLTQPPHDSYFVTADTSSENRGGIPDDLVGSSCVSDGISVRSNGEGVFGPPHTAERTDAARTGATSLSAPVIGRRIAS